MSVYVDDYVYLVGTHERINALWKEFLKAQEDVVQNAQEFTPFVDVVDADHTIYNGSVGVIASKRLLKETAVLRISTTGDCYGHGFGDESRSEFNPILLRLDPKIWESGEVFRIQKTFFNSRYVEVNDPHEVFFKKTNDGKTDENLTTELYEELRQCAQGDKVVSQFIHRKQEEDYRYFTYREASFCCDEGCEDECEEDCEVEYEEECDEE